MGEIDLTAPADLVVPRHRSVIDITVEGSGGPSATTPRGGADPRPTPVPDPDPDTYLPAVSSQPFDRGLRVQAHRRARTLPRPGTGVRYRRFIMMRQLLLLRCRSEV